MKKATLTDEYLYIIYDALNEQITKAARHILVKRFRSKSYNLFSWLSVEDFVSEGFIGIMDMPDGLPISVYLSRAKNRMKNYARDLRAEKRDEFKLLELKMFLGKSTIYSGENDDLQ